MLPAILTAFFFTLSAVFSQRTARQFGALEVNCFRLAIAAAVLGIVTAIVDSANGTSTLHPAVFGALFVSGLVGFGIGDAGLFLAYARLGSRRTILINFCTAVLVGAFMDWVMLRETLSVTQGVCVFSILAGLVTALAPSRGSAPATLPVAGVVFALIAGFGQGFGTTLTGWANAVAAENGLRVHGISQAFQRATAGVLFAGIVLFIVRFSRRDRSRLSAEAPAETKKPDKMKNAGCWLAGTALWGPVIGVSCYQWARLTENSAVVLAVAATSTLLIIPIARVVEKDNPGRRQVIGSILAAAGVIGLCLARAIK